MGSGITAPRDQGSQGMGSGSAVFRGIRDQAVPSVVGSGTKLRHAFGIKDQKFGYKYRISDEKSIPHYNSDI